jgi:F-type H+-transporting ATPase subunit b
VISGRASPGADRPRSTGLRSFLAVAAAVLLGALLLTAVALPVLAAEEGGGHEPARFLGLPRWVWLWANLLLFLGILGYFIVPGVRGFLESRSKEIATSLERARTQQEEARRMKQDLSSQIEALRREMDDLVKRTEADAEREREEILAQAERDRERLLAQTQQEIELRTGIARKELQRYAAELAATLARERIEREVDPAKLQRLFDESLRRLESERR